MLHFSPLPGFDDAFQPFDVIAACEDSLPLSADDNTGRRAVDAIVFHMVPQEVKSVAVSKA